MSQFSKIMEELKAGAGIPGQSTNSPQTRSKNKKTSNTKSKAPLKTNAFAEFEQLEHGPIDRQRLCVDLPAELVNRFKEICQERNFIQRDAIKAALSVFISHFNEHQH